MNPFFASSVVYLTAAVLALALQAGWYAGLLPPITALNWLRVHFLTIGTVLMFAFGAAPMLLAPAGSRERRSPAMLWSQWGLLNLGYIILIVGMAGSTAWLASAGALAVFVAVALLLSSILTAARTVSAERRLSARFYVAAPFYLLTGILLAFGLLLGWPAPGGRFGTLESHIHANVWGFLVFLVSGTLIELLPQLVGRPLAHPSWAGWAFWLMVAGSLGLVSGPWLAMTPLIAGGLLVYACGIVLLLAGLAQTAFGAVSKLPPAAAHLLLGWIWLFAPVVAAPMVMLAPDRVPAAQIEAAALQGLVLGWVLQMVMGGMPVILRRVQSGSSAPPGVDTRADGSGWLSVVLVNLGVATMWLARMALPETAMLSGVAVGMGIVVLGVTPFVVRMWAALGHSAPRLG